MRVTLGGNRGSLRQRAVHELRSELIWYRRSSQVGLGLPLQYFHFHLLCLLKLPQRVDELKLLVSAHLDQITLEFFHLLEAIRLQQVRTALKSLIDAVDFIFVLLYRTELPKEVENPYFILLLLEEEELVVLFLHLLEFELL